MTKTEAINQIKQGIQWKTEDMNEIISDYKNKIKETEDAEKLISIASAKQKRIDEIKQDIKSLHFTLQILQKID